MRCSRCGDRVGPWMLLSSETKVTIFDKPSVDGAKELRATLCMTCAREMRAWLGTIERG